MKFEIFIIDDEKSLAKGIAYALTNEYKTKSFYSGLEALKAMQSRSPDIVLLDISMPDLDGIEVLKRINNDFPKTTVIMITALSDITTVVSAMRLGAFDYILKPIDMDLLNKTIKSAISNFELTTEVRSLQENNHQKKSPLIFGESKEIADIMQFVNKISKSPDTPVLIQGESGTGKELIAKAIHYKSPNYQGSLITMNCAAIPHDLVESELFGYEKGAFSGALSTGKKGLIEQANNGTLFLDEIGDLNLNTQAKLLRFIETGEFYKVGAVDPIYIKTRIISATNKDIKDMIEKRLFRKDLFYRISVVNLKLPSLNNRKDDIIVLAKKFLYKFSKKFNKKFTKINKDLENALVDHHWEGNVRELKNVIESAALIGNGPELTINDVNFNFNNYNDSSFKLDKKSICESIMSDKFDLNIILDSIEKKYYEQALNLCKGNETKAAEMLNVNYSTFRYRRNKLL